MPETGDFPLPELPEPKEIIEGIARELGLDPRKKPVLDEKYPQERLFPEEAPTPNGRYIAGACLEQIYNLTLKYTPPGALPFLSPRDVRWLYSHFRQIITEAWGVSNLPEPVPDFSLTHLLGAARRQVSLLAELKRFHESDAFDPALRAYRTIRHVVERAVLDGDPNPQYLDFGDD